MAQEEAMKKRGKGSLLTLTGCKDLSGKHPVSALLELCTRRRWGPPSFSQVRKFVICGLLLQGFQQGLWSSRSYIPINSVVWYFILWAFECGPSHKKQYIFKVSFVYKYFIFDQTLYR